MRQKLDINKCLASNDSQWARSGNEVATLPDGNEQVLFTCPICGESYKTHSEAEHCRTQPYDTQGFKIGDIVVVPSAYHNVYVKPGDPWWAFTKPADPGSKSHFDSVPKQVPYYVVTAIHSDLGRPHRPIVTLARFSQGSEAAPFLSVGWNSADGDHHYSMYRVRDKKSLGCGDYPWGETLQELLDNCEPCAILQSEAAELAALGISTERLL